MNEFRKPMLYPLSYGSMYPLTATATDGASAPCGSEMASMLGHPTELPPFGPSAGHSSTLCGLATPEVLGAGVEEPERISRWSAA